MTNKQANDSHTDCRADEGIAVQLIDTIINSLRILKRNYIEFIEDRPFNYERYFISNDKLVLLGWEQRIDFDNGLKSIL